MFEIELEIANKVVQSCHVLRVTGTEAMNELPRWEVEILTAEALDVGAAAGSRARLSLRDDLEGATRRIELLLSEIGDEGREQAFHRYTLVLAPALWQLTLQGGYRVFLDKTAHEIVADVLRDAGVPAERLDLRLAGDYARRRQCAQYGERAWSFVERLLADEGISYWFDTADDREVLVLGDTPEAHDGIAAPATVPYQDASGMIRRRSIDELTLTAEITPSSVLVRDFDVQNPDVYIEGAAGEGALSYFEYPAFVPTSAAAQRRAEVRLEQLRRSSVRALAASDCTRMRPGRRVRVEGCVDDEMNREYLVVRVEHAYRRPAPRDAAAAPYRNRLLLVPTGEMPFRPAIPARAPRVEGIESAVITGPPGEEIHVDELGRVKLRFLWDPSGITDDRSSAWVRCLQWPLGGAMLLPRVGWEVPVAYLDGNPDVPFVLGRHYNATAVVPYALPARAATTTLQSTTSPGGGGTNEIRMSDDAGREELFLHAARDQSVSVGGAARTEVGADLTQDVGLSLAHVVLGAQAHAVGGSQSVNVGTTFATSASGAVSLSVGGAELLSAGGNRTVAASGEYTEVVGAAYALQCNQANMQVDGAFVQTTGGSSTLAATLGVTESVAGARVESVGGAYTVVAGGRFADTAHGAKRIQAGGAAVESAGGAAALSAAVGRIAAGSATLRAGGEFAVSGADITIEAASLSAGALEIRDGALRATRGTTKVDGCLVKHLDGTKIA
ncbi:type VI secretion system Vgr family protein [Sorangium sp. So ce385]|uniref:type VI secretion system Vgr family protein n=1 Tax=Sorangium sp. So ce385 TaxID=3133308 RepID=UPI003F5B6B76